MASTAQMEANRRNAQKSTGPKTQRGKEAARINALRHGLAARTVVPVLPHEDPRALAAKIRSWTDDWQPRTAQEADLVCLGARLAWQIDRAERFETAHLSRRVRKAQRRAAGEPDLKRLEQVANLGRKLLAPRADGARAVLVARLEATADGCRWLLDRWAEIEGVNACGAQTKLSDVARFIHLLGKDDIEAVSDPALNALLVAWDVQRPGLADEFWKQTSFIKPSEAPSYATKAEWRELAPRPASKAEARAIAARVRDQQVDRLKRLLAEHEQLDAEDAIDLIDQASFDPGRAFEQHHRYRASLGRELFRTIDALRKLRKDAAAEDEVDGDEAPAHEENRPETSPNEANLQLTQVDYAEEFTPGDRPSPAAERSQFTEPPGSMATCQCPGSSNQPGTVQEKLSVSESAPTQGMGTSSEKTGTDQAQDDEENRPEIGPNEANPHLTQTLETMEIASENDLSPSAKGSQFPETSCPTPAPVHNPPFSRSVWECRPRHSALFPA